MQPRRQATWDALGKLYVQGRYIQGAKKMFEASSLIELCSQAEAQFRAHH
jgi:hypothetical protein